MVGNVTGGERFRMFCIFKYKQFCWSRGMQVTDNCREERDITKLNYKHYRATQTDHVKFKSIFCSAHLLYGLKHAFGFLW